MFCSVNQGLNSQIYKYPHSAVFILFKTLTHLKLRDVSNLTLFCFRYPSEVHGHIDEKRRKFLERNRAAAQRCREKRKQWINNLQSEKFSIQEENSKLHVSGILFTASFLNSFSYLLGQVSR